MHPRSFLIPAKEKMGSIMKRVYDKVASSPASPCKKGGARGEGRFPSEAFHFRCDELVNGKEEGT